MLTVYDDFGNYGHPDHIQVHRVGIRTAERAGTARVDEASVNCDHLKAGMGLAEPDPGVERPDLDEEGIDAGP